MTLAEKYGDLEIFWAVDHSQLEIRFLAQVSKDPILMALVSSGEDIHSAVGHELTGQSIEKIKKNRELRTAIKGIHFGIIYGLKPKALYYKLKADALKFRQPFDMSEEDVTKLYNRYFERFMGVKSWLGSQVEFAEEHEYVMTMFGFKREIIQQGDDTRGTFWMNQAVNTPIQGGAHTLLLIAMAITSMKQQTYNLLQKLAMEGHDALVGYTKLKELVETYKQAVYLMEKEVLLYVKKEWPELDWKVPLKAEAKAGFRYGVLVPYAGESTEVFLESWCKKNHELELRVEEEIRKAA
jgi:DNA polymerase I-like protein with 3'-5' exonuclease and polymerase domains